MNEFNPWTQDNWYAIGSLFIQLAFLVAGVWFARNSLRTLRGFQEQVGALLKLSITSTPSERHSAASIGKSSLAEASPYWLAPTETHAPAPPEFSEPRPSRFAAVWHHLSLWLQAPMNTSGFAPWRRVVSWLQAPIHS